MVGFEERIYELAVAALGEQERRVSEVRSRASALVAAAAVIASLLAKPVFAGRHPDRVVEMAAAVVGVCGAAGVLVFAVLLLRPREIGFGIQPVATHRVLWEQDIRDQPFVDLALAEALERRRVENAVATAALVRHLAFALGALVVETIGFATAAGLTL